MESSENAALRFLRTYYQEQGLPATALESRLAQVRATVESFTALTTTGRLRPTFFIGQHRPGRAQRMVQQFHRMIGLPARSIQNLMATTRPGSRNKRTIVGLPYGG